MRDGRRDALIPAAYHAKLRNERASADYRIIAACAARSFGRRFARKSRCRRAMPKSNGSETRPRRYATMPQRDIALSFDKWQKEKRERERSTATITLHLTTVINSSRFPVSNIPAYVSPSLGGTNRTLEIHARKIEFTLELESRLRSFLRSFRISIRAREREKRLCRKPFLSFVLSKMSRIEGESIRSLFRSNYSILYFDTSSANMPSAWQKELRATFL